MTRCATVDEDADEVAVVALVVVGGGRCRRYDGRTVKWSPFTVGIEHACRIVLELPAEADGWIFTLSKRPSVYSG